MQISIWDLDYYYTKNKKNCFNTDAMKIASYHKQKGDSINFITKEVDINRPYDIYYIIKEKQKTPNPPAKFFLARNVKWWGKAFRVRINWKMSDAMLACRPDYLLYPERNTREERSEYVRLFNNNADLLPIVQDWTNTFTNKYVIITDPCMWFSDKKSILQALKRLQMLKKVSFSEPIWIQKIISDKLIKQEFLKLNFTSGSTLIWTTINPSQVKDAINFLQEFKEHFPRVFCGKLIINYKDKNTSHWESRDNALHDFAMLKEIIIWSKKEGILLEVKMPKNRLETPYFFLFEEIAAWTQTRFRFSWLEYLSMRFDCIQITEMPYYWARPYKWAETFRDLLRQTYTDEEFLLLRWKEDKVSINEIPWSLWKKEFKEGI